MDVVRVLVRVHPHHAQGELAAGLVVVHYFAHHIVAGGDGVLHPTGGHVNEIEVVVAILAALHDEAVVVPRQELDWVALSFVRQTEDIKKLRKILDKHESKTKIIAKIEGLQAGGSTAGGEGIKLAYKIAKETFIEGGNNRVILATDGDFNVGASSEGELVQMIEERRDQGISLTVLGFGMGNIKDNKMEALADKGNGNYAYIDNALEAKKVLVSQMAGTLFTIAKDVKIQVEFNPASVKSYRLIGYENRKLADRDFNDDKKDAGDMGAGHSVTAIYEIVPADSLENVSLVDPLVYQQSKSTGSSDLLQVKVRYKKPGEETSQLMTQRVDGQAELASASENLRFAAAVVEYGMLLRNSEFKGNSSYQQALALARGARGNDENGYRAEFIKLLEISQILDAR